MRQSYPLSMIKAGAHAPGASTIVPLLLYPVKVVHAYSLLKEGQK